MGLLQWLGLANVGKPLELGDPAPELVVQDAEGNSVSFADFYHAGYTMIYFFPKADTPGCTAQACSIRDEFAELKQKGVMRVLGVSADSAEAQHRFKEKHHLPFTLLPDEDRKISQAFGVPTVLGMTHRQSFLLKGGKVVWRDLKASTRWQAQDILKALETLN
jgi:thioredoxin-dependent peroxiredoxin